jgi:hypothetical protein
LALVATFVFVRRPDERAAGPLWLCAASVIGSLAWFCGLQTSDFIDGVGFWCFKVLTTGAFTLLAAGILHLALVFPEVHPLVRRRPWLLAALYAAPFVFLLAFGAIARLVTSGVLDWIALWERGSTLVATPYLVLAVLATVSTYRATGSPSTRARIRWVIFGGLLSIGGLLLFVVSPYLVGRPLIDPNMLGLLCLPFPVALAIAILRYRLFDIDVLINRTLIYGTLTAALAATHLVNVVLLQQAVQPVLGHMTRQSSTVAIVGSTLVIAALFSPLRGRIQAAINRRFYRSRYDAMRTIERFGETLRGDVEIDLARLGEQLAAVVRETMQPAHVSLWLRPTERDKADHGREGE